MIGISFMRVLRAAWQNFWRNIWLSIATTVVMVITLLLMSFLLFANLFGGAILKDVQKKVDLSVEFKMGVSNDYITSLAQEVRSRPDVESVRIITSDEALAQFKDLHKGDAFYDESLKELQTNPLPANMFIVANDPHNYKDIADQLSADKYSAYINKVNYEDSRTVIEKLITIIGAVQNISLSITIGFAVLVILIMYNTVRLAIYSYREEIDIMRLVGASRWFIQGPFLIEAVMVAILAVVISLAILYPALKGFGTMEHYFLPDNSFKVYDYAVQHWKKVIGLQLVSALGLAVFSSFIGIRRYLRN